jgi:rubrerythrin
MEARTHMGQNRTGIQMSPVDAAEMERGFDEFPIEESDERQDLQVRMDYIGEADGLGSVPVPGSVKGVMKSGVDMLKGKRPQVLVDKLGERLAFERGGVRLYDALLGKCECAADMLEGDELSLLREFRNEEAQHFELLCEALLELGADPTSQTPCADLVGVESMGLVQAMNDPRTNLLQALHVMLDAELLDNAAWEMLIELARDCGHDTMAERFGLGLTQEARHLAHLRQLVTRLTKKEASITGGDPGSDGSGSAGSLRAGTTGAGLGASA